MARSDNYQAIFEVLAKIIARGLSPERRETVLKGLMRQDLRTELAYYDALQKKYENNINDILELVNRIQTTQIFFQDVGSDLEKLNYLIKEANIGVSQQPYVFVLMPFKDNFFHIYEKAVRPALQEIGCVVEHSNDVITDEDRIMVTIYNQIAQAKFLVADVTGKNPNVFYELGYAHALGKKVIIIVQDKADIPFDIASLRYILYKEDSLHALKNDLIKSATPLTK